MASDLAAGVNINLDVCVCSFVTYSGFPAEDVTVETEPVLRQVKTPLEQDVFLQSTRVVWENIKGGGEVGLADYGLIYVSRH